MLGDANLLQRCNLVFRDFGADSRHLLPSVSTGLPLSNSQVWTLRPGGRLLWNPPRPLLLETWTRRCRVGKVFPAALQKIIDDQLIHHGCAVWVLVVLICDFKTCLGILGESGGGWRSCTKINWCKVNQQR